MRLPMSAARVLLAVSMPLNAQVASERTEPGQAIAPGQGISPPQRIEPGQRIEQGATRRIDSRLNTRLVSRLETRIQASDSLDPLSAAKAKAASAPAECRLFPASPSCSPQ